MQNSAGREVLADETTETFPVEPVTLASAQESMPPSAADLTTEAVQSFEVGRNCVVREVSAQDSLQPGTDHRHRFVPPPIQDVANRRERSPHPFLHGDALDQELPLQVRSTTMREAEKVERLRSALPPFAPPLG